MMYIILTYRIISPLSPSQIMVDHQSEKIIKELDFRIQKSAVFT